MIVHPDRPLVIWRRDSLSAFDVGLGQHQFRPFLQVSHRLLDLHTEHLRGFQHHGHLHPRPVFLVDHRLARIRPVAEHQEGDHRHEEQARLPQRTFRRRGSACIAAAVRLSSSLRKIAAMIRPMITANATEPTNRAIPDRSPARGRSEDRHHVDCRSRIEERGRGAQSSADAVDPRKHRQHAAGADRQHCAGDRSDRVRLDAVSFRPQVP